MDLEKIRRQAYAPYSKFHVAALAISDVGEHVGTNMENAAYPEGVCAEGAALSAMTTAGGRKLKSIKIIGPQGVSIRPCGGCRQKILEFATPTTVIQCQEADGTLRKFSIADLLPGSFGPDDLT
ncbi:MAG: cytidine deaminase [Alphaproteobacteria bacterium]